MAYKPEAIGAQIIIVRGRRVMLDVDLARIYGVSTQRLNQQFRRNIRRFPADFAFQLTEAEFEGMRLQIATASKRNIRFRPYAFTEHGAIMLASVLNSPSAVAASVEVVRAFVRMRGVISQYSQLAARLEALEKRSDGRFKVVWEVLRRLTEPPSESDSGPGLLS